MAYEKAYLPYPLFFICRYDRLRNKTVLGGYFLWAVIGYAIGQYILFHYLNQL